MRRTGPHISIELVDDLDGTTACETVTFELDGECYKIDLSSKNADDFRNALRPYVDRARIAYLDEVRLPKWPSRDGMRLGE